MVKKKFQRPKKNWGYLRYKPLIMKYFIRFILLLIVALAVLLASQYRSDLPLDELKAKYAQAPSQFVNIDGLDVHYRIEGIGPNLLLIHGTSSSLHTWDGWVERLKGKYRIIRMDMPAFGLTGPNESGNYDHTIYNAFVEGFTKELGLKEFYMAGNSLGGAICWNYALIHPEQIKGMILVDASGYPMDKKPGVLSLISKPPFSWVNDKLAPRMLYVDALEDVYGDESKVTDELIQRHLDLSLRPGNRKALGDRLKTSYWSHPEDIAKVDVPTLIMWGEKDAWVPLEHAELFKKDIKGAELVVIKGAGHVPMEEDPDASSKAADEFFQSLIAKERIEIDAAKLSPLPELL